MVIGNKEIGLLQIGRGSRDGEKSRKSKKNQGVYAPVPAPHDECSHYVKPTYTNKNKK